MVKKYQITLFCSSGEYKPVACIVNNEQSDNADWTLDKIKRKELQRKGIIKIAQKRYWTTEDLKKYHYTKCKMRAVVE
jgi:hypothetical protein